MIRPVRLTSSPSVISVYGLKLQPLHLILQGFVLNQVRHLEFY